ncbi:Queuosine Biosynthesis QueE Radical SAM [hydrothermal vent metagenome]|uniref:Queuosine Biosynthesis QueE Radical SAM n=1 Tax=hydrothermal vent metagenome TaxID=652676 RepID=A0A1W1BS25_9ZZZZ
MFYSLQGESNTVGIPTVFIRLTGCPLRCVYCDTEYAFKGENLISIADILKKIKKYNTQYICVTGGEPLAQNNCFYLLDALIANDYKVSLETSGSISIKNVPSVVDIVMDLKTPSSEEVEKNNWDNLKYLQKHHQVKFVIGNKRDFEWSVDVLQKNIIKAEILFSPIADLLSPTLLADWILKKQLKVRMQFQLHKILWQDTKGK